MFLLYGPTKKHTMQPLREALLTSLEILQEGKKVLTISPPLS